MDALTACAVLTFGRGWIDRHLGPTFDGPVFLAGGVFKTLLHGRPPRDIDLWAPDVHARDRIVQALLARGHVLVRDNHPYQALFRLDGVDVEVSYNVTRPTLEGRVARSDLGLSAVGYSRALGRDRCVIDPVARQSVARRQVLLLKPLVNWKYALYTLERLRRYAQELGYEVPAAEEAHIWDVFTTQDESMRRGMVERYRRVSSSPDDHIIRKAGGRS